MPNRNASSFHLLLRMRNDVACSVHTVCGGIKCSPNRTRISCSGDSSKCDSGHERRVCVLSSCRPLSWKFGVMPISSLRLPLIRLVCRRFMICLWALPKRSTRCLCPVPKYRMTCPLVDGPPAFFWYFDQSPYTSCRFVAVKFIVKDEHSPSSRFILEVEGLELCAFGRIRCRQPLFVRKKRQSCCYPVQVPYTSFQS